MGIEPEDRRFVQCGNDGLQEFAAVAAQEFDVIVPMKSCLRLFEKFRRELDGDDLVKATPLRLNHFSKVCS
jgi:hypothetical protein